MKISLAPRLQVILAALSVGLVGVAGLLFSLMYTGYLRGPVIWLVSRQTGREIKILGALHFHASWAHPTLVAEKVIIGNPSWTAPGITAEVGKLTLVWGLPLTHAWGLESLVLESARLHLLCDEGGRANWQRTDPASGDSGSLPMLQTLEARDTRVELDDARRHLQFRGTVSAYGDAAPDRGLRIEGSGQLNGREAQFELKGAPLEAAVPDKPYAFTFDERSSGSHLNLRGSLPRAFDLNFLDADFEAAGADLSDLHYLVGLSLVNTGKYRLAGRLARRGTQTAFEELEVRSGDSDVHGSLNSVIQKDGRTRLTATLKSQRLRMADLGLDAAGRDPNAAAAPRMFSDAPLGTDAMRRVDADVHYHAAQLQLKKLELTQVEGHMSLEKGMLAIPALTGGLLEGTWQAAIRMDVNPATPEVHLDLNFADVQLALLPHKSDPPPLEGALQGRILIAGRGRSLHQVAASAVGSVQAAIRSGLIRDSLAEMAGTELRGFGLALTHSKREARVQCAAVKFAAYGGSLKVQTFVIDTDPVLILGSGSIDLDDESLALTLRGTPKSPTILRLAAPLRVAGTLSQPHVEIEAHEVALKSLEHGANDAGCKP